MKTSVLGDVDIQNCMQSGQVIIEPFEPKLLNSSSYDVRLGGWFYLAERVGHRVDFSPYDEAEVSSYYRGPYKAISHAKWCEEHRRQLFSGISEDELIIVLKPGECILAHTIEYIGAAYGATTMMKARSSLGRINVSACDDAGWGDVGYINRWTMEVRNKNREVWVPLVVGMPIAQVVFFWVENADINYAEKGNYQRSTDLSTIKASWTPDSMLPRLFSESNLELRKSISSNAELVF